MARQALDDWALWRELERRHKAAVERKNQKIAMFHAILDSWAQRDDYDPDYLRDVRKRLHQAEAQKKSMKP
jgi:hypothetical protein